MDTQRTQEQRANSEGKREGRGQCDIVSIATNGCRVQYMGLGRAAGVLCHSPMLPLSQHTIPTGVEHGRGREGHQLPQTLVAQCSSREIYYF